MSKLRITPRRALAACAAICIAGAGGGVAAASLHHTADAAAADPARYLPPLPIDDFARTPEVQRFGLLVDQAHKISDPGTPDDPTRAWTVVPGTDGICVSIPASAFCGSLDKFQRQGLIAFAPPPRVPLDPTAPVSFKNTKPGPGPTWVRGLMPPRFTQVIVKSPDGTALAQTAVGDGGAFQVALPDGDTNFQVTLVTADGDTTVADPDLP